MQGHKIIRRRLLEQLWPSHNHLLWTWESTQDYSTECNINILYKVLRGSSKIYECPGQWGSLKIPREEGGLKSYRSNSRCMLQFKTPSLGEGSIFSETRIGALGLKSVGLWSTCTCLWTCYVSWILANLGTVLHIRHLSWVVQKVVTAIHGINPYPAESVVCFLSIYTLDSYVHVSGR